jgi:flagellar basal body-associated protein FliL
MPPPVPTPVAEPPRSHAWMIIIVAVVVIAAAAAFYWWFMIMPSPVSQEQLQAASATQISVDADAVAAEINALSTDGLDAELDQIDRELAQ